MYPGQSSYIITFTCPCIVTVGGDSGAPLHRSIMLRLSHELPIKVTVCQLHQAYIMLSVQSVTQWTSMIYSVDDVCQQAARPRDVRTIRAAQASTARRTSSTARHTSSTSRCARKRAVSGRARRARAASTAASARAS